MGKRLSIFVPDYATSLVKRVKDCQALFLAMCSHLWEGWGITIIPSQSCLGTCKKCSGTLGLDCRCHLKKGCWCRHTAVYKSHADVKEKCFMASCQTTESGQFTELLHWCRNFTFWAVCTAVDNFGLNLIARCFSSPFPLSRQCNLLQSTAVWRVSLVTPASFGECHW